MANAIYKINKGINRPIEFKGLKAQYIWWLAGGLVGVLLVFVILYVTGVNSLISLGITFLLGSAVFAGVYKLSHRYGEHGMQKKLATRSIPRVVKCYSRKLFI